MNEESFVAPTKISVNFYDKKRENGRNLKVYSIV